MTPWTERNGRFSWLKAPVFLLTLAPGLWIATQAAMGWLGPKPVTEAIHQNGDWIFHFLLLSLTITPLRFAGRWPKLVNVRRMLGVAAMCYALIHLSLYIVDQKFDMATVVSEIALRFYLTIGFVALCGLIALGATSTDAMIARLGSQNWNRLHNLVYPITLLGLVHFFIQSKLNVYEPLLMSGVFFCLMGWRGMRKWKLPAGPLALALLAVSSAVVTGAGEVLWYWLTRGIDPMRVLNSQFDFSYEIRPAWWTLALAAILPITALVRGQQAPRSTRPVHPSPQTADA